MIDEKAQVSPNQVIVDYTDGNNVMAETLMLAAMG
jgi:hypothetical protein